MHLTWKPSDFSSMPGTHTKVEGRRERTLQGASWPPHACPVTQMVPPDLHTHVLWYKCFSPIMHTINTRPGGSCQVAPLFPGEMRATAQACFCSDLPRVLTCFFSTLPTPLFSPVRSTSDHTLRASTPKAIGWMNPYSMHTYTIISMFLKIKNKTCDQLR